MGLTLSLNISPDDVLLLNLCVRLDSSHQRCFEIWSRVDGKRNAEQVNDLEKYFFVENHLSESFPLFLEEFCNNSSL